MKRKDQLAALHPDTVLDIGANVGESLVRFRGLWPQARLYAFEPRRSLELKRNARRTQAQVFWTALGEVTGRIAMAAYPEHPAGSSLLAPGDLLLATRKWTRELVPIKVPICRLDDLEIELRGEVFVKIDVQGYTDRVLKGGERVIRQARWVQLEVDQADLYEGHATEAGLRALMGSWGFEFTGILYKTPAWFDGLWTKISA